MSMKKINEELTPMEKEVLKAELVDHIPQFSKFLQGAVKHLLSIISNENNPLPICGKWDIGDVVTHKDGSWGYALRQIYDDCVMVQISKDKRVVWRTVDTVD